MLKILFRTLAASALVFTMAASKPAEAIPSACTSACDGDYNLFGTSGNDESVIAMFTISGGLVAESDWTFATFVGSFESFVIDSFDITAFVDGAITLGGTIAEPPVPPFDTLTFDEVTSDVGVTISSGGDELFFSFPYRVEAKETVTDAPEPAAFGLLALGLAGLCALRSRRRDRAATASCCA